MPSAATVTAMESGVQWHFGRQNGRHAAANTSYHYVSGPSHCKLSECTNSVICEGDGSFERYMFVVSRGSLEGTRNVERCSNWNFDDEATF